MRPDKLLRNANALVVIVLLGATGRHLGAQTHAEAIAQQDRGDWVGAEATWRKLTVEVPGDFRYWTSLGACLAHQNRFSEAIADYRKAVLLPLRMPRPI